MNNDNQSEQEEPGERKGFLKQLLSKVPFGRPETTEDLENEILELLEEGEEHGLISPLEEKMINSIFDFRDTEAAEIMTPAAELFSLEAATPISDIIDSVIDNGFTRVPVYRNIPDNVIGVLHVKDLLQICARMGKEVLRLEDYLRPVTFIPENKPIVELLREFQMRKNHMAMVTDEFGAVRGLVTLEDIIEEIVGEIDDEYDDEQDELEKIDDNTVMVHARLDIERIEEFFDVEMPDGPYESVGGLVINLLGRLGKTGDKVTAVGLLFEVKSASKRHIKMVKVSRQVDEGASA
ncbi:hemolysin family protein [Desulfopila aestuarii]|uniref:CBS domain-containing protein n=1 Tax=Desulfopila aestuarii DSM 18488 TaxID=1121416 RepID=A0A1M7Y4K4_9BACT|nr:hemolysin family protein [Desulfopila aestuarii]SHO47262.1 CBS domain-containing protein [Desulfopila aestuarii DSM 18488]